jgi:gliding motility-associated-like protein
MNQQTAGIKRFTVFLTCSLFHLMSWAQLQADFIMDKSGGCSPLTVNFTNRSYGASPSAQYKWDFGNSNTSTLTNPGAIYKEEQSYTVTLTVTDNGKTSTKTATVTVYKKPTVDFSVNRPKICMPESAIFNVTGSPGDGYISNYFWDFGDGITQQGYGSQMNHNYTYVQKPTVSVTVTNNYGCYNSITKSDILEVMPTMQPAFSPEKNIYCLVTDNVQFTNTSSGPGTLSYTWDFGDGTSSTAKDPAHVYNKKGLYNVKLTLNNTDGCSASTNFNSLNIAYFNTNFSNTPLCRQLSFNSSSYLYPSSSFWEFGDGTSSNSFYNATHVYNTAGTYTVKLINTYGACTESVSKDIEVKDLVAFNSDFNVPSLLCKDNNYTFISTSSTTPSSTIWEFGDGGIGGWWGNANHTYSQPGDYTIKLTNTFGTCKEVVTKNVKVNDLPNLQGFVADMGGVCGSPVTVQFKDTTAGAVKWQWSFNYVYPTGYVTSSLQNPSYQYTSDGSYNVSLTVTNAAGCTRSTNRTIYVYKPQVSIALNYSSSPRGGNYDCDSLVLKLTAYSNVPLAAYDWKFGDGTSSTEASPQHGYYQEGSYTITLNYTTESGCKGTTSYSARVYGKAKANFDFSIPCGNSLALQFRDVSYFSDRWYWDFGDGNISYYGYSTQTNNYRDTGKYMVKFVSHIGHCSDTIIKQVYANVLPSSVSITKAEKTCNGTRGTVEFDQYSLRATGLTWNFGDGTSIPYDTSNHAVSHTYTQSGNYTVTLTGSYNNCILTSTVPVTILLKQNPTLTANKTEICSSDNLNVQIGGVETNPYTSNWEWGQYNTTKFLFDNGQEFTGNGMYNSWRYTSYTATLQNFTAGVSKMRAVIRPSGSSCLDTTNFISLKVNGPIAGFKILEDGVCYKTSPIVFEDTSKTATSTPIVSWQWNFGDATQTYQQGGKVSHMYTNPGGYYVNLTVRDASGCTATTPLKFVSAKGPKANFAASGLFVPNVPLNTTVNFYNNTYANSTSLDYLWQFGDGATSTNYSGQHTYTQPGTDTVKLIVKDPSINCADTAKQVIYVKDFNTAFTFTSSYVGNNNCPPVVVRINNLSVGAVRVVWDFGDGTTADNQFYPSHTYYKSGTYKITLYTYGYNGLTGTYIDSITIKEPNATIAADVLQGCVSQGVNLKATSSNTTSYFWDFGDGTLKSSADVFSSHNYLSPGVYSPRLIIKSENGCITSTVLAEKIIIDSLNIAIKGIPSYICNAGTINFTPEVFSVAESQAGQTLNYQWDFGTGNTSDVASTKNASFAYTTPGTYIVKLKATSPYGCMKETTAQVVIHKRAKGSITGPAELCENSSALFKAAASGATGPLEWYWDFDNGNNATSQNPSSQLFTTPKLYNVQLVVKHDGCYDTTFGELIVHPKPVIGLNNKKAVVCLGNSLQLSASGGKIYSWSPATGLNNASIANPVASPEVNIKYLLTVSNEFGCTNKDSVDITVAQPIAITAPKDTFVCAGSTLQLKVTGASSYKWINNTVGLNNTTIANPSASLNADARFTVVGYDAYGCFTDTATVNVVVRPLPSVNAGPDIELLANTQQQLQAVGSSDVIQWLWTPSDYLSCTNCSSPVTQPKTKINYVVTVKNQYGCQASDEIAIKLQCSKGYIYIPNSFTPNNDDKNDVFYIKGKGVGIIKSLKIFNRWGEMVFAKTNFPIDDRSAGWDGYYKGHLAPIGSYVYFAEFQCEGEQPFTEKGVVTVVY